MVTFESKYNGQIQSLATSTQVTTYLAIRCFHLLRGFLNNNISRMENRYFYINFQAVLILGTFQPHQ
jgi:hypothetical protein